LICTAPAGSCEQGRPAAQTLQEGKSADKKKTLIFVNNRLEGNALETIRAMIDGVEA
jgi:hypothetical protein